MYVLRRAEPGEEAAVAGLWKKVYGDDEAFLEAFYRCCLPFDRLWVAEEEGVPGTILSAPRVTVRLPDGRELRGGYLYALASEPSVRGQGLGRALMEYGASCLKEEGADCALLVPAEPSLFRYFDTMGYIPAFSHLRRERPAGELLPVSGEGKVHSAEGEEYNGLRRRWLEGRLAVDCPVGMIEFQRRLAVESGGDLLRLDLPGGAGCAAVELYDGVPVVKELLCAEEDTERAQGLIAARFPAPRYVFRLPPWSDGPGERVLWGAVLPLREDCGALWPEGTDGYLGIALD